ncbi:MAG: hypothetical protein QG588_2166, partial [Candidatus Poribacteria bacterium]|nr:hypothetical protein [Candidatus Poribacteria bacterium]
MLWSLLDTLEFIAPKLNNKLVSPQAFSNVVAIANRLPNAISSFILESRVGENDSRVDFSTCVIASEDGQNILVDFLNNSSNTLTENPLWNNIREFCIHWADQTSILYGNIPFIWLEFDLDYEPMKAMPVPSVFISLDRTQSANFNPKIYRYDIPKCQKAVEMSLELLNRPVSSKIQQNLSACLELLPDKERLPHIGVMLSRQSDSIRITVNIPEDRVLEYLTCVGWTGQMTFVKEILTKFYSCRMSKILVSLDIADTILPDIGIEFGFHTLSQTDLKALLFFDRLEKFGLCTSEKHNALLSWSGFSWETYPGDSWPTKLWRSISHIKILSRSGSPLMAKAYLWFSP